MGASACWHVGNLCPPPPLARCRSFDLGGSSYNKEVSDYVRPTLPSQVYYDRTGAVIDYGNRWGGGLAPQDSYGVDSNPQRFAPLHLVADALIQHLTGTYAVTVSEDAAFAADLMHEPGDVLRAVRVVPANPDAAPLTFVYTSYPGVILHAGRLHDFPFPQCGCDGCDETAESAAQELEWTVLAVAAGGYAERVNPSAQLPIGYEIVSADGTHRGRGERGVAWPAARLRDAASQLRRLPGRWQPWST
jgi:hypothetical protein